MVLIDFDCYLAVDGKLFEISFIDLDQRQVGHHSFIGTFVNKNDTSKLINIYLELNGKFLNWSRNCFSQKACMYGLIIVSKKLAN